MGKPKKEAVKPAEPKKEPPKPAAPAKEAVRPAEPKGTLTKAKETVAKAAGKVAAAVTHAAEAVQVHVVQPVVAAVEKPKRKRFVREKKEKVAPPAPAKLPERSTKATAKLMTKGLALPPKEEQATGQKPRA